jgi:hypothetical protein
MMKKCRRLAIIWIKIVGNSCLIGRTQELVPLLSFAAFRNNMAIALVILAVNISESWQRG